MSIVYVITNNVNGKQYVGTTNFNLNKRFKEHCRDAKKSRYKDRQLYLDMNEYGVENFCIEELEECQREDRFDREAYWVNKLDTYNNGYNHTFGGVGTQFYDYKVVSDMYVELGTVKAVCNELGCDPHTVRIACRENNVDIISGKEQNRITYSKPVEMLDKYKENILRIFPSMSNVGEFLGNRSTTRHVTEVCNGKRKTAYGYKWRWHN